MRKYFTPKNHMVPSELIAEYARDTGMEPWLAVHLASDVDARCAELEKAQKRYEKVRRLSVPEFARLCNRNIWEGSSFDELVDELP